MVETPAIQVQTEQSKINLIQESFAEKHEPSFITFKTKISQFLSQFTLDERTEFAFLYMPSNIALFQSVLFLTQYAKRHFTSINLFDEDKSICFYTVFNKKDSDYIGLMDYAITHSKCIRDFSFYGVSGQKVLNALRHVNRVEQLDQATVSAVQSTLCSLSLYVGKDQLPDAINLLNSSFQNFNRNFYRYSYNYLQETCMLNNSFYSELYEAVLKILSIDSMQYVRWKSEFQLFLLTKYFFPDAIYQYHDYWLGQQSIDIYIPSEKLGIEYQGIQHYQPVKLFGGEEGFLKQKENDMRKQAICKKWGITLIEWKYSESINQLNFENKLKICINDFPKDCSHGNKLNLNNFDKDIIIKYLDNSQKNLEKIWLFFVSALKNNDDDCIISTWESILKDFKKVDLNNLFRRAISSESYGEKFLRILIKSKTLLQYYLLNKPNLNYYKKKLLIYLIKYGENEDFIVEQLSSVKALCVTHGNIRDLEEFARTLCLEADDYQMDTLLAQHIFKKAGVRLKRKN